MSDAFYTFGTTVCRIIHHQCVRSVILHPERADQPDGCLLACTHVSHLEPFIISAVVRRKVNWMARVEFYRNRLFAWVLDAVDAFSVNRQGVPVEAIRTAIQRVKEGAVVGIFPEGGVRQGQESVMRGGVIKLGACVIAYRADTPVIPVVVLGTEKLNRVRPWLPWRRARLWIAFGRPIYPNRHEKNRRAARFRMGRQLQAEFMTTYQELLMTCNLDDTIAP